MRFLSLCGLWLVGLLIRTYFILAAIALCAIGAAFMGAFLCLFGVILNAVVAGEWHPELFSELWKPSSMSFFLLFLFLMGKGFFDYCSPRFHLFDNP